MNPTSVGGGLSLAQGLMAAQDGTLTAANIYDEHGAITGARFTIAFFKTVV